MNFSSKYSFLYIWLKTMEILRLKFFNVFLCFLSFMMYFLIYFSKYFQPYWSSPVSKFVFNSGRWIIWHLIFIILALYIEFEFFYYIMSCDVIFRFEFLSTNIWILSKATNSILFSFKIFKQKLCFFVKRYLKYWFLCWMIFCLLQVDCFHNYSF